MQFIVKPTTNPLFKQVGRGKAFRRAKGSMETYKGMKGRQEEKPLLRHKGNCMGTYSFPMCTFLIDQ